MTYTEDSHRIMRKGSWFDSNITPNVAFKDQPCTREINNCSKMIDDFKIMLFNKIHNESFRLHL